MKQEFTFTKRQTVGMMVKLRNFFESLDDGTLYKITIDKVRKKRSLDANAYFWELCDKVAAASGVSKTDVYRGYVREIAGNSDIVCVRADAADRLCAVWEARGLGWVTDRVDGKINEFVNVILYYGSSTYDSAQMARLIDLCVQDCRALDIETQTPAQLALLTGR